jgi:hypothetical protein
MSDEVRTALERAELEDPGETLRFPLSMGDLRSDQDHKGQSCHVLDIVFNIDVLKQAQTFRWPSSVLHMVPQAHLCFLHLNNVVPHALTPTSFGLHLPCLEVSI